MPESSSVLAGTAGHPPRRRERTLSSYTYNKCATLRVLAQHIECEHGVTPDLGGDDVRSVRPLHVQRRGKRRGLRPAGSRDRRAKAGEPGTLVYATPPGGGPAACSGSSMSCTATGRRSRPMRHPRTPAATWPGAGPVPGQHRGGLADPANRQRHRRLNTPDYQKALGGRSRPSGAAGACPSPNWPG